MQVALLGPLEVTRDGEAVPLPAPLQRTLLAVLALNAGRVVSADRLMDAMWGDEHPSGGVKTLRYHVSKLRTALGDADRTVVETAAPGYRLSPEVLVDVDRFAEHVSDANIRIAADPAGAQERLDEAQALWRGPPLGEFEYAEFARVHVTRLDELWLAALELGFRVELELGRHSEAIPGLSAAAAEHPYREVLRSLLITAMYRAGRQSDALREYQDLRTLLGEELGILPSPELVALEASVLHQDQALDAPVVEVTVAPRSTHNMPARLSPFLGREAELDRVEELLGEARLVSLTGPGGVGKTRLALEAARRGAGRYRDGVWVVDLSASRDTALVPQVIAAKLGIFLPAGAVEVDAIGRALEKQSTLLVLDNFEHVIDAAPVVATLLQQAPDLTVLATSRERLRLTGEQQYRVPPLRSDESAALFRFHARAVRPDYEQDGQNAVNAAAICAAVDGLPLAIELAAARMDALTTDALLTRLQSTLRTLNQGSRDHPDRHQTLRSTIEWSLGLLTEAQKLLFLSLGVFEGGRSLDAVEAVADAEIQPGVLDGLQALVDKSLIRQRPGPDGQPRYFMLETLHEYARERLAVDLDPDELRNRHCAYYVELAARVAPLLWEADPDLSYALLNAELENLRQAIAWGFTGGDPEQACRILGLLNDFWITEGHTAIPRLWDEHTRSLTGSGSEETRAALSLVLGHADIRLGRPASAVAVMTTGLALAQSCGDELLAARIMISLALAVGADPAQYDEAIALCWDAVEILDRIDAAPFRRTLTFNHIALLAGEDEPLALEMLGRARQISVASNQVRSFAIIDVNMALMAEKRGDFAESARYARQALEQGWRLDQHRRITALSLHALAMARIGAGDYGSGAMLFGASHRACRAAGLVPTDGVVHGVEVEHRRALERLGEALSPADLSRALEVGESMPLHEAVAHALGGLPD